MANKAESEMLAEMLAAEMEEFDPGVRGVSKEVVPWTPRLNKTQEVVFNDGTRTIIMYGPKFSSKSIGCDHKVVRHCYEEWDALAWVLGNSYRTLALGVCNDFTTLVLPTWHEGNRYPLFIEGEGELTPHPQAGELMDEGIGLEYDGWKIDSHTKDSYMKIRNKFGGWSRIQIISIEHAAEVESKVKGPAPSMVYLEEGSDCKGRAYYKWPMLQLGRRRDIVGPQQFLISANPKGPSNWLYDLGWKTCVVPASDPNSRVWPHDPVIPGIRRSAAVAVYFVPYSENRHNVTKENQEAVEEELRHDDIERRRLILGEWIDRPSGEALFKNEFSEAEHIRGVLEKKRGLSPVEGYPIVVSMDWGKRSLGIVFQQLIETEEGTFHIVIDEISYYQELIKTSRLAVAILEKMRYWNEILREDHGWTPENSARDRANRPLNVPSWCFWFIAGDDATTNFNPTSGSIDARDLEDQMRLKIEEEPERYLGIDPNIHINGCPRPKDSIGKRVDIVAEELIEKRVVISALCPGVRGMFFHLERDEENPSQPKKGNRWIHIFDGLSYAVFYRRFRLPGGFYNFEQGGAVEVA